MNKRHSLLPGVAALVAFVLTLSALTSAVAQTTGTPSVSAADRLERKISVIEAADTPSRAVRETMQVSELELESYVLYRMKEQIPVRVDGVDLDIQPGRLGVTADLFVDEALVASRSLIGPLFVGAHTVFFEGTFEVRRGLGTMNLEGVRVDGIVVPVFLVKALLNSLDDPVDLDAPFQTSAGIDEILLRDRSVSVTY